MVPLKLTLKNFLSYGSKPVTVDFSGLRAVAIVGPNGAGKSSLLDAITWVLFGKARTTNEKLIRTGARDAEVTLEFSLEGQEFKVWRKVERREGKIQTSSTLEQRSGERGQWQRKYTGADQVRSAVSRLLHSDASTFLHTVLSSQGEHGNFMEQRPAERRDLLARLLELDVYQRLMQRVRDQRRSEQVRLDEMKRRKNELSQELTRLGKLQTQKEEVQAELDALNAKSQEIIERRDEWQRKKQQIADAEREREEIQSAKNEIRKRLNDSLQRKTCLEKEALNCKQTLEQAQEIESRFRLYQETEKELKRWEALQSQWKPLEEKRQELEQQIENEKRTMEVTSVILQQRIKDLDDQISKIEKELEETDQLEEEKQRLAPIASECEMWDEKEQLHKEWDRRCQDWKDKTEKERARRQSVLTALSKQIDTIRQKVVCIDRVKKDLGKVKDDLRQLDQVEELRKNVQEALTKKEQAVYQLKGEIKQIEDRIQEIKDMRRLLAEHKEEARCPVCQSVLTPQTAERLIREFDEKICTLGDRMGELRKSLATNEAKVEEDTETLRKLTLRLEEREEVTRRKGQLEQQLESLELSKNELDKLEAERQSADRELRSLETTWDQEWRLLEAERAEIGYNAEAHRHAQEMKMKLSRVEERLAGLERKRTELRELQESLCAAKQEKKSLDLQLINGDFAHDQRKELKAILDELSRLGYDERKHRSAEDRLRDLSPVVAEKQRLGHAQERVGQIESELAKIEEDREELTNREANLNERLCSLDKVIGEKESVENNIGDCNRELRETAEKIGQKNQELGAIDQEISSLEQKKKEFKELESSIGETETTVQDLNLLERAFGRDGIPKAIMETMIGKLQDEANRYLSRLTHGRFSLGFRLARVLQGGSAEAETVDISVQDELGERPYETYSGGEKFRIDFAVRVALANLLSRRRGAALQTLILDEGFGTQDKEGLDAIKEAVDEIGRDFALIAFVTHLDELASQFPAIIEITKDSEGSNCRVIHAES